MAASLTSPRVSAIPIDLIVPGRSQARRHFDPDRLADLAQSIRESGLVQPIVLRSRDDGQYELLAGERRWRAAQLAGLHELPAILRDDIDDDQASVLGLVENLQRESLSPIETASGLRQLVAHFGLTHEEIGRRIGKSRVYVTNFLRLLGLEPEVQSMVDDGRLTTGHAKVLLGLPCADQRRLAGQALHEGLSVRALERRIAAGSTPRRRPAHASATSADVRRLETALAEHLGYAAELRTEADGSGSLNLRFHDLDELDGLLARIGYTTDSC